MLFTSAPSNHTGVLMQTPVLKVSTTCSTEINHPPNIIIFTWNFKPTSYAALNLSPTDPFRSSMTHNLCPLPTLSITLSKPFHVSEPLPFFNFLRISAILLTAPTSSLPWKGDKDMGNSIRLNIYIYIYIYIYGWRCSE